MSYAVYTTRGFIVGSAQSGEASKIYSLYTESFGLIFARAQSVRLLSSKLRYGLKDYSLGAFSLVRGKEFWRLTGVEGLHSDPKTAPLRARVLSLVKRLVQGEERNDKLFSALLDLTENSLSETELEVRSLSKILSALGYLDEKDLGSLSHAEALKAINKALRESQL